MNPNLGLVLGTKTVDQSITVLFDSALKIIFVLLAGLYLVFAFVVIRQITIMKKTLITPFSPIINLIGYLHFLIALLVFCFFLVL
jgi:hypothetical protein